MKRLVLFVEGPGDIQAVLTLVYRVLEDQQATDTLFVDSKPFKVQGLGKLMKNDAEFWRRTFKVAGRKSGTTAILLRLDGDSKHVPGIDYKNRYGDDQFCAARAATLLSEIAREEGAGNTVSLSVVFAVKEFETWIAASIDKMGGVPLAAERAWIQKGLKPPDSLEAIRNMKGWLHEQIGEYKPTLDQEALARHIDIATVRDRSRSFRRFENAIKQLVDASRSGGHICTP